MSRRSPLTGSTQTFGGSREPTEAESTPVRPSRAAIAVDALRRGVTTRAAVSASASALRRRATSRGSIAAAALRRLAS